MKKGLFITFEGADGCGKTTQLNLLAKELKLKGYNVVLTREPGCKGLGEDIRNLLLNYDGIVADKCESFLFLADRAQNIETIVKPAIKKGDIVLSDRHTDSSIAYQGYGRGLDIEEIKKLNKLSTGDVVPDLTIIFDIDVKTSFERVGKDKDRMENSGIEFFNKVRNGYLEIAKSDPLRVKVINANDSIENIFNQIIQIVQKII